MGALANRDVNRRGLCFCNALVKNNFGHLND